MKPESEVAMIPRSLIAAALVLIAAPAWGQWPRRPAPGIPRLPDGKPNLAAPAPKSADGKAGSARGCVKIASAEGHVSQCAHEDNLHP